MADTEAIVSQGLQTGGAPNISDAYTINGLPGPLHNCSAEGTVLRGNAKIVLLTETLLDMNLKCYFYITKIIYIFLLLTSS
jgi:hypothetical protein